MSDFERYGGKIHDRAKLWSPGQDNGGDFVVLAGNDETDQVGFQIQVAGTTFIARIRTDDAIRLGRLLVAAAQDTLSRPHAPAGVEP
jgi:hypothetical protein